MTPKEVIKPLLPLPEKIVRLLYKLLEQEIELGHPSLAYTWFAGNQPLVPKHPEQSYSRILKYLFSKAPPLKDIDKGQLWCPIHHFLNRDELIELLAMMKIAPRYEEFERAWINGKISDLERRIHELKQNDLDYFHVVQEVKEEKEALRNIKDPHKELLQDLQHKTDTEIAHHCGLMWQRLLNFNVSFDIPRKTRLQHSLVVGATGSGKTSVLEQLIYADIQTEAAVIVMTLKGDLLSNIARLACIPKHRLLYLNPQNPIPLNLFSLGASDSSVELINKIFSDADAQTTARQTPLLNHSIRLLSKVEGANLRTLRTLLKADRFPSEYESYLKHLSPSAQEFFLERFNAYKDVKDQLFWRLDLLTENTFIQQVFCQPHTELNMAKVMSEGKVLLIDTSVKELGEHGSNFLGRSLLALVTIEAQKRHTLTRPVYFYVDEAGSYLTPNVQTILERTRESRVGMTLALQNLADLKDLEPTVMTNTSVKLVGKVNESDARKLATVTRVPFEALIHQPDLQLYLKAFDRPIRLSIRPGFLAKQDQRTPEEMQSIIAPHRDYPDSPHLQPQLKIAAESTPDYGTDRWE